MIDLCQYAVSVGEQGGADEVEAIWVKEITNTIEAELGEISTTSAIRDESMRIRVIKDRALSSMVTYRMNKEGVSTAVERALAAARASKKDEKWNSLPSPGRYPQVPVWDPAMEDIGSDELIRPVLEMLDVIPDDILASFAAHEVVLSQRACVNSCGIEHTDRGTVEEIGMVAVGKLEDSVTPAFFETDFQRTYNPIPQKIAEPLIKNINLFRKTEPATSGKSTIIFAPSALDILLEFTLFRALSGGNVARGKSLLAGKEGKKVSAPVFTVHDDGTIPDGVDSREMDDEGVPRQDTPLIENGVLQGFIWNDYWAKRMGVSSTGNAHYDNRNDEMLIQQNTMVITPGDYTREELFDVKDGYYILDLQGAHSSNPESGDFSVLCTPAFRIKKGEITGGATGTMLSDNVFSLLEKVDAIGREPTINEHTIFPHTRFVDVNVAAK
jgi:PmbA protein